MQHPGSRVVARASLFPRQPLYRGFTGSRPAVLHVATSAAAEDAFSPFAGEVSWLVACLLRAPSVWGSSNFSERADREPLTSPLPTNQDSNLSAESLDSALSQLVQILDTPAWLCAQPTQARSHPWRCLPQPCSVELVPHLGASRDGSLAWAAVSTHPFP